MRHRLTQQVVSIWGILLLAVVAFMPLEAFAQLTNVQLLVFRLGDLVQIATPVLVGIALLVFFWGLVKFIFRAGNEEARKEGKQVMIWGIIVLFVIVSIWGIVQFIASALYLPPAGGPPVYYPATGPGGGPQPLPSSSGTSFPTSEENVNNSSGQSPRNFLQGS